MEEKCNSCNQSDMFVLDHITSDRICTNCGTCVPFLCDTNNEIQIYSNDTHKLSRVDYIQEQQLNPFTNEIWTSVSCIPHYLKSCRSRMSYTYQERSYINFCTMLSCFEVSLCLTKEIIDTCKHIFSEFMKTKEILRGHVRLGFVTSCIFLSCKHHRTIRTYQMLCRSFNIDYMYFHKGYKRLHELVRTNDSLRIYLISFQDNNDEQTDSYSIEFVCSLLQVPYTIRRQCYDLTSKYHKSHFSSILNKTWYATVITYALCEYDQKEKKLCCSVQYDKQIAIKVQKAMKNVCVSIIKKTFDMLKEQISSLNK